VLRPTLRAVIFRAGYEIPIRSIAVLREVARNGGDDDLIEQKVEFIAPGLR